MYEFFESRSQLLEELGAGASQALARALLVAARGAGGPQERLLAMGLAYVRFALRRPEDFLLLFGRVVSRRRSLCDEVAGASPYGLLREAVAQVIDLDRMQRKDPRALEAFAYGYWSTVHGMAMLRLTHLAGFKADFETGSRVVLASVGRAWAAREGRG